MLALANGLITSPRLLLLDEPSLGLAPQLIADALKANPDAVAVYITHCETSTATVCDVEAIAKVVARTPAPDCASVAHWPIDRPDWDRAITWSGSSARG